MKRSTHHILAAILSGLFGLFLTYGSLTSSEFSRGLYVPPVIHAGDGHWADFAALHPNLVLNYRSAWDSLGLAGMDDYMDSLGAYGLKAILRNGDWDGTDTTATDSIPFLIEHYSCGQYKKLEVEVEYDEASHSFYEVDGTGYYYFNHWGRGQEGLPPNQGTWHLDPALDDSGTCIQGLYPTAGVGVILEPKFDWPKPYNYDQRGRTFLNRIRAKIDKTGHSDDEIAMIWKIDYYYSNPSGHDSVIVILEVGDFLEDEQFQVFDSERTFSTPFTRIGYRVVFCDVTKCWVDWIEYMDKEQGYPLFVNSETAAQTLQQISEQCSTYEDRYGALIERWAQSDEPGMTAFDAHGVVNDYLAAHGRKATQSPYWARPDAYYGALQRKHFVKVAKPPVLDVDIYPFLSGNSIGDQTELDTLAELLEAGYQATGDTIQFHFTAQAHSWWDTGGSSNRNPRRSELLAESYMALAHGARGLSFWKYLSATSSTSICTALVWTDYSHTIPILAEKWLAVQDVFTQLDAIGDTLLRLEREAAYCASNPSYQSPITGVHYEEEIGDTIEVGQFHDSADVTQKYLILVNRRTDGDRHITVETSLDSTHALRDIYTQEQFISSTGDFRAIPFEAGEGRVFKLAAFNDWIWANEDKIVLADTVYSGQIAYPTIAVSAGAIIRATKYGCIRPGVKETLDCNGNSTDSVVFTALEADAGWTGLRFDLPHLGGALDTLSYAKIEFASNPGIKVRYRDLYAISSEVRNCSGDGINAYDCNISLKNCRISENGAKGVFLSGVGGSIVGCNIDSNGHAAIEPSSASTPGIGHCEISNNGGSGIKCYGNGTIPILLESSGYPNYGHNSIYENDQNGIYAAVYAAPELGRDANRQGQNGIWGHVDGMNYYDVKNLTGDTLFARYNYWGGTPADSQFYGMVDSSHWLRYPPGDSFMGGGSFVQQNPSRGSDGLLPDSIALSEANRLNNVAVELFLDGEYYSAIDTFDLVVDQFPGTSPARFALNHLVVCYREADDYGGAVAYLDSFLQPPTDSTLSSLALYHKVLNLARLQEYVPAIAIAGNSQLMSTMPQDLQEPLLIELGMMQKYGMQNVVVGNAVFQQFLQQFPESLLAPIAAMELGIAWEPRGTSGSGAGAGIGTVQLPERFYLEQNHPNPFNPATTITFGLPVASWVKVEVFDIAGRLVGLSGSGTTPTTGYLQAGVHEVTFDGSNLPSGIYICRLQAGDFSAVEKMVLLK